MTDPTQITTAKPAAQSATIQGSVLQLIVSLTAVVALLMPSHADQINSISAAIQGYWPMVGGIVVAVMPFIHTVLGRFNATQPLR